MTDNEIQRKLNQLVKIANDLSAEARNRWGEGSGLYYADGAFNLHDPSLHEGVGDMNPEAVHFRSLDLCRMDGGAW